MGVKPIFFVLFVSFVCFVFEGLGFPMTRH